MSGGLSVVVPSVDLQHRAALEALATEVASGGAQLVVATSSRTPLAIERTGSARVLRRPGSSIFELRAAALNAARADIVAVTEDHVLVPPGWCAAIVAAHARHPEADVIGGPVENAARERLFDWANFLMTFGTLLPPVTCRPEQRAPAIANVSVKRRAIRERLRPGEFEFARLAALIAEGRVVYDDAPRVWHLQSHGARGTLRAHFDNGRSTTGIALQGEALRERLGRVYHGRPLRLLKESRSALNGKPLSRRAHAGALLLPALCLAHAAGEWAGALVGPGASPQRLR